MKTFAACMLAATLTAGTAIAQTATQDTKNAGHETAAATKDAGHAVSNGTEKGSGEINGYLRVDCPAMERKRSGLSQEVMFDGLHREDLEQVRQDGDVSMREEIEYTKEGNIVVQSVKEEEESKRMWRWGIGGEWKPGVIQAAYEVSGLECPRHHEADLYSPTHICLTSHCTLSPAKPHSLVSRHIRSSLPFPMPSTRTSYRAPSSGEPQGDWPASNTSSRLDQISTS